MLTRPARGLCGPRQLCDPPVTVVGIERHDVGDVQQARTPDRAQLTGVDLIEQGAGLLVGADLGGQFGGAHEQGASAFGIRGECGAARRRAVSATVAARRPLAAQANCSTSSDSRSSGPSAAAVRCQIACLGRRRIAVASARWAASRSWRPAVE